MSFTVHDSPYALLGEIERSNQQVASLQAELVRLTAERAAATVIDNGLLHEVARLRAALEQVARVDCYGYIPPCECITCIAREALAGGKE